MQKSIRNFESISTFLVIFWMSLISSLWVYDTLNRHQLPTTDIGQWIMYSRWYSGESVPSYRVPLGVSPFLPVTLAIVVSFLGDSIRSAITISSALLFLLTFIASYLARELDDDITGLIACFLFGFGQYFIVYLISFGGLPQLGAIVSMCLGYFGVTRYSKRGSILLVVISCILFAFFHFPSAPFYFITIAASLWIVGLSERESSLKVVISVGKSLIIPVLAWFTYFIIFFEQEIAYTTNAAGFYRRGIEQLVHLWLGLSNNKWVFLMVLTATINVMIMPFLRHKSMKSYRSAILVLIWFLIPAGFMLICYFLKIGTDYSRFQFYLIPSLIFSLAFLLNRLIRKIIQIFNVYSGWKVGLRDGIKRILAVAATIGLVIIIINNALFTIRFFPVAVEYYSLDRDQSFLDLVAWIRGTTNKKLILSPFLEAMWIEGLTGQSTIFPNKFRNLYRPGETDRSLVASILSTGSSTAVENGYMLLRYQHAQVDTLFNPNIALYQRGEFVDVFNIQDRLIRIEITNEGKKQELNLEEDFWTTSATLNSHREWIEIVCEYYWNMDKDELRVTKSVSISKTLPEVRIVFHTALKEKNISLNKIILQLADSLGPTYKGVAAETSPINQSFPDTISINQMGVFIQRKETDGESIHINLEFSPYPSTVEQLSIQKYPAYLSIVYTPETEGLYNIELTTKFYPAARFREGVRVMSLGDIIKDYNISQLIIESQNIMAQQIYEELNFPIVYSNQDYIVFGVQE